MTFQAEWVIWNGSLGVLDMVAIGKSIESESGRNAFLAPPYDIVGPFSLDELETQGKISFGECIVMSRLRWQEDQVELRLVGRQKRRALYARVEQDDDETEHRVTLDLPRDGTLQAAEINAAFRRLAKTAHPDAGGDNEQYRRITEARDALLDVYGEAYV
jgi:hypothetical protein